ncbi:hypothetical protein [Gilvimarinus algae]|uniref:Uncharacterized protein n=1 Tax=Gilvimarinus algae TaxID=3058037 RepID=A0ABT8TIC9_9GAMM|nr:hypothetical protein [Gilvimarinus sp. SDUM040014]MDO3383842.1 hypothetical protein [Gilvimarinus sp. SDUM040014]
MNRPSPDKFYSERAPIEIGLVIIGRMDRIDKQAIQAAREQLLVWLQSQFPQFAWRISAVQREEVPLSIRQEPSALLRDGSDLRDAEGWDFAILFTAADLTCRYKPYSIAVTSSALDLAVVSTNRIDPHAFDAEVDERERIHTVAQRLTTLCIRSLGHLNGLATSGEESNFMQIPSSPKDLSQMSEFGSDQHRAIEHNLHQIADPRLEETQAATELSPFRFYLQSAYINRHEIFDAVRHARPWEFPLRLLRLTAAAVSTTTLLMLTAETWHLASNQAIAKLAMLLGVVLVVTTALVAVRQRLLIRRRRSLMREQIVITNCSAVAIVLIGLATTAAALLALNLSAGFFLYAPDLVASWVQSAVVEPVSTTYWQVSLFVTTLGLFIGALGATFEQQHHFRHVVFVDEEI